LGKRRKDLIIASRILAKSMMTIEKPDTPKDNINHAVYMLGKLTDVIIILIEGEGNAKSRLLEATHQLLKVKPYMLPITDEIRKDVDWAFAELTKYRKESRYVLTPEDYPRTIFDNTIHRIKNRTASKIIRKLFGAWMRLRDFVEL
jgi:hypothetical protein